MLGRRFRHLRNGDPPEKVAPKVSKALYGGVRKALKQFREHGVTLAELLNARDSRPRLRRLVRQIEGQQYAQIFESTAPTGDHSGSRERPKPMMPPAHDHRNKE